MRRYIAMNCWHMNHYESAAMWRLYLKSDEGIAIRSTYERLKTSLNPCADHIYVGAVKYIDFETEWMPEGNIFYPFVHKRKSFAHEQELRAVIVRFPEGKPNEPVINRKETMGDGISVDVDLNMLIEEVRVSPSSPLWLTQLVVAMCRRYKLDAKVGNSSLSQDPVY